MRLFSNPKLYHFNYDLKKKWFVGFSFQGKQFQFRGKINLFKTKKES
jgi:hypothetical protein